MRLRILAAVVWMLACGTARRAQEVDGGALVCAAPAHWCDARVCCRAAEWCVLGDGGFSCGEFCRTSLECLSGCCAKLDRLTVGACLAPSPAYWCL